MTLYWRFAVAHCGATCNTMQSCPTTRWWRGCQSMLARPAARIPTHRATTQLSKIAKAGVSARLMTDLSKHVPAATQVLAGRLVLRAGMASRACNLFISNIPGPQVPLYMNGALQVGAYGMAPLVHGMGLFIATPSYNGEITFNVTSTRDIVPDMDFFVDCLEAEVEELKSVVKPKKKAKKKKAGSEKPGQETAAT